MLSSLEKLQKFIALEIRRNFDNKAVVGGLEKVLEGWLADARREQVADEIVQEIVPLIQKYKDEDIDARSQIARAILRLVGDGVGMRPQPTIGEKKPSPVEHSPAVNAPARRSPTPADYAPVLFAPLTAINGIGPSIAKKLARLDLYTINDLLQFYPRRYDDFSNLLPINRLAFGEEVTAMGTVKSIASRPTRNPRVTVTEAVLTDGTGFIRLSWFNQPYLVNVIQPEMQIVVSGKVEQYSGRLTISNPEWEKLESEQLHTNRIVPVYSLTGDLKQRSLRSLMYKTVSFWASRLEDFLPESILRAAGLMDLPTAIAQVHFPDSMDLLRQARQRIAFNEIFLLQVGALQQKQAWQTAPAAMFSAGDDWVEQQESRLPYALTSAQKRAIVEIRRDLASGTPMNRLLQGDVGAGKTLVAAFASAIVLQAGAQVAILAPTSILAEQHYLTLTRLFSTSSGDPVFNLLSPSALRLLTGGTSAEERAEILQGLQSGQVRLVVGTHALLEDPVQFQSLQLVVIDEQHRFGVRQRAALRAKGENPHLLVMTATPIPRSLALTIYGDLDLSVIDELPPGRQQVETHVLLPIERERAYSLIRSQIQLGRQAFIIYPFVENEDGDGSNAAVTEYERLKTEVFRGAQVGLVHGRLKPEEKDEAMESLRDRRLDVLVATSVIEVGVDVPNATVMMIEGANRFGLAQLHQLRGRVGRGEAKSYCLLIPETDDALENERLVAMTSTNDGFILAERDLAQRGPGEFLGLRQSGYSNLKIASLSNIKLIEQARQCALQLFSEDPRLEQPGHQSIKSLVQYHWQQGQGDFS